MIKNDGKMDENGQIFKKYLKYLIFPKNGKIFKKIFFKYSNVFPSSIYQLCVRRRWMKYCPVGLIPDVLKNIMTFMWLRYNSCSLAKASPPSEFCSRTVTFKEVGGVNPDMPLVHRDPLSPPLDQRKS